MQTFTYRQKHANSVQHSSFIDWQLQGFLGVRAPFLITWGEKGEGFNILPGSSCHTVMHCGGSLNVTTCLRFWLSEEAVKLSCDGNAERTENLIVLRKPIYLWMYCILTNRASHPQKYTFETTSSAWYHFFGIMLISEEKLKTDISLSQN